MKELYLRWQAKTPLFWKKVGKFGVLLTTISGSVIGSGLLVNVPEKLTTAFGYIGVAGVVIATLSRFAIEDKEDIK